MNQTFKNTSTLAGSRNFTNPKNTKFKSSLYEGKELRPQTSTLSSTQKKTGLLDELNQTKKAKTAENIEEQYIKGLQDEVKLLEYEMKLLKDKESDEVQNFSHFFKFFNDGVPINENIIAMKNLYQATEKTLNEQIQKLKLENAQGQKQIEKFKREIDVYHENYKEVKTVMKQKVEDADEKIIKFNTANYDEIFTIEELEPKQKIFLEEIRRKNNEINIMRRDEEKENLYAEQKQKSKDDIMKKNQKTTKELEEIILEKRKIKENEEDGAKFEQEKNLLDAENENLKKKILSVKNDINMANVKKAELEFVLESLASDREVDQRNRRVLNQQIEDVKTNIENENKMTETVLQEKVKEKEKEDIRKIEMEIENITKKELNLYQDRIQFCTREIEQMVFAKVDLSQKITDAEDHKQSLEQKLQEGVKDLHDLKRENNLSLDKESELQKKLVPLENEVRKIKEKFPKLTKEIEFYQQQIESYKKQLELINEVKNFNFEEIKMIASTNHQINGSINTLIKKWENIEMQSRNV